MEHWRYLLAYLAERDKAADGLSHLVNAHIRSNEALAKGRNVGWVLSDADYATLMAEFYAEPLTPSITQDGTLV